MTKKVTLLSIFISSVVFTACSPMQVGFEEESMFYSDDPIILFADDGKKESPKEVTSQIIKEKKVEEKKPKEGEITFEYNSEDGYD